MKIGEWGGGGGEGRPLVEAGRKARTGKNLKKGESNVEELGGHRLPLNEPRGCPDPSSPLHLAVPEAGRCHPD